VGPSPVSLGDSAYANSRRTLNEVIKLLRDVGTEEFVTLPKIAVIGNQSAGKSSLIEAIAKVKVPRASGTCTRCPMEVTLSTFDPSAYSDAIQPCWYAKVSLRITVPPERMATFEFGHTTNRDDVPLLLSRAQLALLNPGIHYSEFTKFSETQCQEHDSAQRFSPNTVVLEIYGDNVDISFVDLPGIISNVANVVFINLQGADDRWKIDI